jgi:carboxypeptidase Taq
MSLSSAEAYAKVSKSLRDINNLEGISGLLGWDEMVMLPPGSSGSRGAQKETLAGVLYDKKADSEFGALLNQLSTDSALDKVQAANVRIANADHQRLIRVPKELVQEQAKLETDAYNAWVEARTASDYSKFSGVLQAWVDSKKKEAEYIEPGGHTYDTLLYSFEKGMSSARLDEIFEEVKAGLVPLISDIKNKGSAPSRDCLDGKYDVDAQAKMCKDIALDLGFDIEKGRLDVSVHPFSKYLPPSLPPFACFVIFAVLLCYDSCLACLLAFQVCWCA